MTDAPPTETNAPSDTTPVVTANIGERSRETDCTSTDDDRRENRSRPVTPSTPVHARTRRHLSPFQPSRSRYGLVSSSQQTGCQDTTNESSPAVREADKQTPGKDSVSDQQTPDNDSVRNSGAELQAVSACPPVPRRPSTTYPPRQAITGNSDTRQDTADQQTPGNSGTQIQAVSSLPPVPRRLRDADQQTPGNDSVRNSGAQLQAVSPRQPIAGNSDTRQDASGAPSYRRYLPPPSDENRSTNPAAYGTKAATVSYAIAGRLASPNHQEPGITPSFTAPWAHIHSEEPRQISDRFGVKRPRISVAYLDTSRLRGQHNWITGSVQDMRMNRYVLSPDVFNRRDVQRIRMLYEKDNLSGGDVWSRKRQQREWFEIPHSLRCDRTFARDALECYYLERLDEALQPESPMPSTQNIPILEDPLLPRWWTVFKSFGDLNEESWFRSKYGVLVPHDDLDVKTWDPSTLRDEYPPYRNSSRNSISRWLFPSPPRWQRGIIITRWYTPREHRKGRGV